MKNTNFTETYIEGIYTITPEKAKLSGEIITESYDEQLFYELGLHTKYTSCMEIDTQKGILRGLHYDLDSNLKKLIRVIKGEVYYVVADMRKESKTFGKHYGIILDDKDEKMLYVPEGFAEGYLVFSDTARITFRTSEQFTFKPKRGIVWNDPDLKIEWFTSRVDRIMLSRTDQRWPRFAKVIN